MTPPPRALLCRRRPSGVDELASESGATTISTSNRSARERAVPPRDLFKLGPQGRVGLSDPSPPPPGVPPVLLWVPHQRLGFGHFWRFFSGTEHGKKIYLIFSTS